MALYVIERSFADQLDLSDDDVELIEEINSGEGVRWLFSFLSADRRRTYCLYEAPSPEAILAAARKANVPPTRSSRWTPARRSSRTACATGPTPSARVSAMNAGAGPGCGFGGLELATSLSEGLGDEVEVFGSGRVARVDVDFLSGPKPTGSFNAPSTAIVAEKEEFGASRSARWFGR